MVQTERRADRPGLRSIARGWWRHPLWYGRSAQPAHADTGEPYHSYSQQPVGVHPRAAQHDQDDPRGQRPHVTQRQRLHQKVA
eukprot:3120389-Pyramimonas_sp.AAC.1